MKLINITSKPPKIISEEQHLERMSKLPFINTLLEKISHIKNTNIGFEGKYINIRIDISKLSRDLLSLQYKTELNSLKMHDNSINEKSKRTQKILNERVTEWYAGEKISTPSSIIYREIDNICAEKNLTVSTKEKHKILDEVNKKYIKNIELERKSAVSSISASVKSDSNLVKKINEIGIKEDLVKDMNNEIPEQLKILKDNFNKKQIEVQGDELQRTQGNVTSNEIPVVRIIAGKIKSDVYNGLIGNIYNTLFRDTETEHPLDFDAIKTETRTQVELIAKKTKTSQNNEISIEDIVQQRFYSETKVTSSSPEKDLEDLLDMLASNPFTGDISDQRAPFNPGIKVTSSSSSQSASSVNNMQDQSIDDIFDILNSRAFTDRTDDQRASLGNKKA